MFNHGLALLMYMLYRLELGRHRYFKSVSVIRYFFVILKVGRYSVSVLLKRYRGIGNRYSYFSIHISYKTY